MHKVSRFVSMDASDGKVKFKCATLESLPFSARNVYGKDVKMRLRIVVSADDIGMVAAYDDDGDDVEELNCKVDVERKGLQ